MVEVDRGQEKNICTCGLNLGNKYCFVNKIKVDILDWR